MKNIKRKLRNLISEVSLKTYKSLSPQGFPSGWDVASDIERILENRSIEIIFDVGANIGELSSYFHINFPKSKILSFEPVNETFKELKKNVGFKKNINCYQYALGATNEYRNIYLSNNSQQNSLLDSIQKADSPQAISEMIEIQTIEKFCLEHNINKIDLLKMDTEGFETNVLRGAENLLETRKISFILSEVGFRQSDQRHTFFSLLYDYLYKRGFRFYGLYDLSYWHPYFYEGLIYCNALFVNPKALQALK